MVLLLAHNHIFYTIRLLLIPGYLLTEKKNRGVKMHGKFCMTDGVLLFF